MEQLILRQAAIDAVRAALLSWSFMPEWRDNKIIEAVEQLPPIQPKRGRWIDGYCSECGAHAPFWAMASTYHKSNFCPNCGVNMRGEQE